MQLNFSGIIKLLLISFFLISCNKESITYVQTVAASGNPSVTQTDTFSAKFIISRPDSFVTNTLLSLYAGYHNDPVFGKIKCEPYLRFSLPYTAPETTDNAVYDSLVLILYLDSTYYGDTTSIVTLSVNRVLDNITSSSGNFYNSSNFGTYPTPLGNFNKVIRPQSGDSICIKISNTLGNEIFDFYKNNSSIIKDSSSFLNYLRGFKLETDNSQTNLIYGIKSTATALRMYYHADVGRIVNKSVDFTTGNNAFQFTHIDADRTGTILQALDNTTEIDAANLGNKFYTQELTGIRTRINFLNLDDILKQASFVKLLAAELEIKPVVDTYNQYPLAAEMYLYQRDISNTITGPMYDNSSTYAQNGNLSIDKLYQKDTRYIFDVTSYITSEITSNNFTTKSIVPLAANTHTRLICGTTSNKDYRTRLIVTTLTYHK